MTNTTTRPHFEKSQHTQLVALYDMLVKRQWVYSFFSHKRGPGTHTGGGVFNNMNMNRLILLYLKFYLSLLLPHLLLHFLPLLFLICVFGFREKFQNPWHLRL